MKVKDILKESLEPLEKEGTKIYSIVFSHFLMSIADILVIDAFQRLKGEHVTNITDLEDNEVSTVRDVHEVLCHSNLFLSIPQGMQLKFFLEWFLDYDIKDCDSDSWYDIDLLAKKWNEFAQKEMKKEDAE